MQVGLLCMLHGHWACTGHKEHARIKTWHMGTASKATPAELASVATPSNTPTPHHTHTSLPCTVCRPLGAPPLASSQGTTQQTSQPQWTSPSSRAWAGETTPRGPISCHHIGHQAASVSTSHDHTHESVLPAPVPAAPQLTTPAPWTQTRDHTRTMSIHACAVRVTT